MTLGTANNRRPARPRVVYSWVTLQPSQRSRRPTRVECVWSLVGANGERMCSSFPEGYRDKADARRAVHAVIRVFYPPEDVAPLSDFTKYGFFHEVGPGPKPEAPR